MIHFTRPKLSYTRQYIYHNEDILAELDGNNNLVAFYIHGPGIDTPLAMMRDRNLDGIIKNDEVFVYTRDHQSSVRELTDLNGVVVQRYDYTAYGETTVELNGEVGDRLIENPYGYTGRVHDRETGFYFYRARYYSPSLRRFLSPEPTGTDGPNLYWYTRNNPVNYIDPTGLICIYSQASGYLACADDQTGEIYLFAKGYSGTGEGRNNPALQGVRNVGPIPKGEYTVGKVEDRKKTGTASRHLIPTKKTRENFPRKRQPFSFYIHGEGSNFGDSSEGCPVFQQGTRRKIKTESVSS